MRAAAAILFLLLLPVLFEACEKGGGGGKFTIKTINAVAQKINQGHAPDPAPSSLKTSDLLISVQIGYEFLTYNRRSTTAAYADEAPPTSVEKITSFTITSDSVLTTAQATFAPGEDVASVFYDANNFYFQNQDSVLTGFDYTFRTDFTVPKKQKHNFKFSIGLDDGRKIITETGPHELLPEQ